MLVHVHGPFFLVFSRDAPGLYAGVPGRAELQLMYRLAPVFGRRILALTTRC
jgi:hypothetical protein